MSEAAYHELFPLGPDDAPYRKLTSDYVSAGTFEGQRIVKIDPAALTLLAREAFVDWRTCSAPAIWRSCARCSMIRKLHRTTSSSRSTC